MITSVIIFAGVLLCTSIGLFLTNYLVNRRLKGKLDEKEIPQAIFWLKGLLFIALGLAVQEIFVPLQTLSKVLPASFADNDLKVKAATYFCLISTIALFAFAVVWWISTVCFGLFSSGRNIYMEALNNNTGLVLLFGAILLAFMLAAKPSLSMIADFVIPYPKMPIFR